MGVRGQHEHILSTKTHPRPAKTMPLLKWIVRLLALVLLVGSC